MRQEFFFALANLGFIPLNVSLSADEYNANSKNNNLVKAIMLGGLWPNVARAHLPRKSIKFEKIQGGALQRENTAKEFKIYDIKNERVFLHPTSILFDHNSWKSPFLTFFSKQMTSKVFVRDASQVSFTALQNSERC